MFQNKRAGFVRRTRLNHSESVSLFEEPEQTVFRTTDELSQAISASNSSATAPLHYLSTPSGPTGNTSPSTTLTNLRGFTTRASPVITVMRMKMKKLFCARAQHMHQKTLRLNKSTASLKHKGTLLLARDSSLTMPGRVVTGGRSLMTC